MTTHLEVDRSPFHRLLGLELVRANDGVVEMRLPWRDELARADGSDWFHGGVISALIDIAGDYAIASRLGRGVPTIIDMVQHTRLDCVIQSSALMRQGLIQALHHCSGRSAFGKRLIDQPLMQNVLADLAIEAEAATISMLRLVQVSWSTAK